jgi:hypothetical protein
MLKIILRARPVRPLNTTSQSVHAGDTRQRNARGTIGAPGVSGAIISSASIPSARAA